MLRPPEGHVSETGSPLRAVTYLAPGIPEGFFRLVVGRLARELGREIELYVEDRISGPMHGGHDPFASGEADLGFLCSPSFLYLRERRAPSVELVEAAFAFHDYRTSGEPVYFSDVIVRASDGVQSFEQLRGTTWGYNDECSLSGYFCALHKLQEIGCKSSFFGQLERTGSHGASIASIVDGSVDAAAIDSTVLGLAMRARPELSWQVRVIETWGPWPVQPVVVRSGLADLAPRIASVLLSLVDDPTMTRDLSRYNCIGFREIRESAYGEERDALAEIGALSKCDRD